MTQKLLIILACAMVLAMFPAAATSIPTCADGQTYAYYESTYNIGGATNNGTAGCLIGDKIFGNFTYTSSNAGNGNLVGAANVTVNDLAPGNPNQSLYNPADIGLQFNASWIASGANSQSDSAIGFTVTVQNGGPLQIEDASVVQGSAFNSTGSASVLEQGCGPAPCVPVTWTISTVDSSGFTNKADHTFFTPVGSVQVIKDINTSGGSNATGFAHLTLVQDAFSQTTVPEPRAISLLLGFGLVAGLALRKKFQSVRG